MKYFHLPSVLAFLSLGVSLGQAKPASQAKVSPKTPLVSSQNKEASADAEGDVSPALLAKWSGRSQLGFTEAIALYTQGRRVQSYKILEKLFDVATTDADRVDAATILAYADNKQLKLHKRHFYSDYVAKHLPDSEAKFAMFRVAGDGFFEDVNLTEARKAFQELLKSPSPSDQDYAHYKLGWIDLNENHAELAFDRWYSRVNSKNGSMDLRSSLIHDLGRAWAETRPTKSEQLTMVQKLQFSDSEANEFQDGVSSGIRRIDDPKELSAFRETLRKSPYYKYVLPNVLSQGVGLSIDPCSVMDWFDAQIKPKDVDPTLLIPRLSSCFVEIRRTKPDQWKEAPEMKRLLTFYDQIDLAGMRRWPRAIFLKETRAYSDACQEFALLVKEDLVASNSKAAQNSSSQGSSLTLKDGLQNMIETCRLAHESEPKKLAANTVGLGALVDLYRQLSIAKIITSKADDPLYGIVALMMKFEGFRRPLARSVTTLEDRDFYVYTLIPSMISEAMTPEERHVYGIALLKMYAPKNITTEDKVNLVWIELLRSVISRQIQVSDYQGAHDLLSQSIALKSLKQEPLTQRRWSLWLLWALATDASTAIDSQRELAAMSLSRIDASASPEMRTAILTLALKHNLLISAWEKWSILKTANSALLAEFYQKSFLEFQSGLIPEALLAKDSDGRKIIASVRGKPLQGHDGADLQFDSKVKPAFVEDMKFIQRVKTLASSLQKVQLKFSERLPKVIEARISEIQSTVKAIQSRSWSNTQLGHQAKSELAQACDAFASQIDQMKFPKAATAELIQQWKGQLSQISSMVRGWQQSLLADGGGV